MRSNDLQWAEELLCIPGNRAWDICRSPSKKSWSLMNCSRVGGCRDKSSSNGFHRGHEPFREQLRPCAFENAIDLRALLLSFTVIEHFSLERAFQPPAEDHTGDCRSLLLHILLHDIRIKGLPCRLKSSIDICRSPFNSAAVLRWVYSRYRHAKSSLCRNAFSAPGTFVDPGCNT